MKHEIKPSPHNRAGEPAFYDLYRNGELLTSSLSVTEVTNLGYTLPPAAFKVGDKATHTIHTDSHAGYIVKVSPNGKTVLFGRAEAKLLNSANSGEPDALKFSAGGFVGHTSGEQRWDIATEPMPGYRDKFTLRSNGRWVISGGGTYSPGNSLSAGHHPHYDFNF